MSSPHEIISPSVVVWYNSGLLLCGSTLEKMVPKLPVTESLGGKRSLERSTVNRKAKELASLVCGLVRA